MTEEQLAAIEHTAISLQDNADYGVPPETYYCRDVPLLIAEVRRLREELRDFGEHAGGCYRKYTEAELRRTGWTDAMLAGRVCTCGLDEAIG